MSFASVRDAAMRELGSVLEGIDTEAFSSFCNQVYGANRIVCFGLGREGLALRGFCMRLMHLGLDAHMAGDVTAQPVGPGDVLIVTSGPGDLAMTSAMIKLGKKAACYVIVVTAQRLAPDPEMADHVLHIPAQTMANDLGSPSILPMGTAFEIAMGITFDLAVIELQSLLGQSPEQMRARHFNLE